ncbi:MAG TPA: MAPEG family protein [Bauldia sp.]|nr:MAPEG family protein [Bauldia sp.]
MGATTVLLPVFVEVALTLGLLFWVGSMRVAAVRSGLVKTRDIALREPNWPPHILRVANAYQSQLELPVLFYLVSVLALFTGRASLLLVVLAWLFVVSRLLHALIHVTTNNVPRRFFVFLAGAILVSLMWLVFAADLVFGA